MKFITLLVGVLMLTTATMAANGKENLSPQKKTSPADHLKILRQVNNHNTIFHDYHTGGIPYEPYNTLKGKSR